MTPAPSTAELIPVSTPQSPGGTVNVWLPGPELFSSRTGYVPAAGVHTFAFFTNGDGLYDQAGWAITEQES